MTGIDMLKSLYTTAGEIADIISAPCPPTVLIECDRLSCRECWFAWLASGEVSEKVNTEPETSIEWQTQCEPDELSATDTASIYKQADYLLENLIYQGVREHEPGTEPAAAIERQRLIVYLMKLNRREEQLAQSSHRGELMELARLMETEYIEFRIKSIDANMVVVAAIDIVLHQCVAELGLKKTFNSYALAHYKPFSPARSDSPETPSDVSRT